jgi:hypothetical protein
LAVAVLEVVLAATLAGGFFAGALAAGLAAGFFAAAFGAGFTVLAAFAAGFFALAAGLVALAPTLGCGFTSALLAAAALARDRPARAVHSCSADRWSS